MGSRRTLVTVVVVFGLLVRLDGSVALGFVHAETACPAVVVLVWRSR